MTAVKAPRRHSAPQNYRAEIGTPQKSVTKMTPTSRRKVGKEEKKGTFTLVVPEPQGNNVYCKELELGCE